MRIMPDKIDRESRFVSQRFTGRHPAPHVCRCRFKSTKAIVRTCRTLNNANGDGREEDLQQPLGRLKVTFIIVASVLAGVFSCLQSGQAFGKRRVAPFFQFAVASMHKLISTNLLRFKKKNKFGASKMQTVI